MPFRSPVSGKFRFVDVTLFESRSQHETDAPMHFFTPSCEASLHRPSVPPKHGLPTSGSPVSRSGSASSILPSQSLSTPSQISTPPFVGVHWYPQGPKIGWLIQPSSHWV